MTMKRLVMLSLLMSLAGGACAPSPPPAEGAGGAASVASLTDREWVLVALGERTSVLGARGEPPTLRLGPENASGFAGCNRYSGGYELRADNRLRFETLVSTRMACTDAGDVETAFLSALAAVRQYRVTETELTLLDDTARPVARFRAR